MCLFHHKGKLIWIWLIGTHSQVSMFSRFWKSLVTKVQKELQGGSHENSFWRPAIWCPPLRMNALQWSWISEAFLLGLIEYIQTSSFCQWILLFRISVLHFKIPPLPAHSQSIFSDQKKRSNCTFNDVHVYAHCNLQSPFIGLGLRMGWGSLREQELCKNLGF